MSDTPKNDTTIQDYTLIVAPDSNGAPAEEYVHQLLVVEGAEQGRVIEIDSQGVTIGRVEPSIAVLRDVEISRCHCNVYPNGGSIYVDDLKSTNGTFVDGRRITMPVKLAPGSLIRIGRHMLKYEKRTRREIEASRDFERSLEGASRYVQSMLPAPIAEGPVRTEWLLLPCARLGGDALGYQHIDDNHFSLYLLDVSGHGPEAAMLAVGVMNALRQSELPGADIRDPAQVVSQLNRMFQMENHGLMYFTLWYGVYAAATRTLSYCAAGQHPAYLTAAGTLQPLHSKNPAVGVTPAHGYKGGAVSVEPGAKLYLFSDGVFEIDTQAGERWALDDFLPILSQPPVPGLAEPQRVYQAVQQVARRGPLDDDFSVLVARFV